MAEYLNSRWEAHEQFQVWRAAACLFMETGKPYSKMATFLRVLAEQNRLPSFAAMAAIARKDA